MSLGIGLPLAGLVFGGFCGGATAIALPLVISIFRVARKEKAEKAAQETA